MQTHHIHKRGAIAPNQSTHVQIFTHTHTHTHTDLHTYPRATPRHACHTLNKYESNSEENVVVHVVLQRGVGFRTTRLGLGLLSFGLVATSTTTAAAAAGTVRSFGFLHSFGQLIDFSLLFLDDALLSFQEILLCLNALRVPGQLVLGYGYHLAERKFQECVCVCVCVCLCVQCVCVCMCELSECVYVCVCVIAIAPQESTRTVESREQWSG
jgi:hypothetical protein